MTLTIVPETAPLSIDNDGVARVAGTRVRLDTIVGAYRMGATAESIAQGYPSVKLGEVYAVIAYYIRHRADIDTYIHSRELEADRVRREFEAEFAPVDAQGRNLIGKP